MVRQHSIACDQAESVVITTLPRPTFYATANSLFTSLAVHALPTLNASVTLVDPGNMSSRTFTKVDPINERRLLRTATCENTLQKTRTKSCTGTKNQPLDGTSFGAADVGVCILETKHNRKTRVRTRYRDTGGRLRERVDSRADVNKPRAGSSTALTILGTIKSGVKMCGRRGS